MKARAALLLAAWVLLCGASYTAHREVKAGNAALAAGDPKAAVDHYERAQRAAPDDPAIAYDAGTARLAAGDLDAAVEALGAAAGEPGRATAPDAKGDAGPDADTVRARAAFNLGNAHLERAQGQSARADLQAAVDAYRRAIAADPDDPAARRNLQIAATRLRDLPPPRQQPQQQSAKNGPQQGKQNSAQSSPSPSSPQRGQQPQQAGKPSQDDQGATPAPSPQGADTGPPKDEGQGRAKADGKDGDARRGELPEDVTRALAALRRKESAVMREALRRGMGQPEQVEPDW
jgi:Ca-activated chloride channel homolog